jgi:membrane protein
MIETIKKAISLWWHNDPSSAGAALAFYALFSIPPILIIVVVIAGIYLPPTLVQGKVILEVQQLFGPQAGKALVYFVRDSYESATSSLAAVATIITILIGSLGVFGQLQLSLNRLWGTDITLNGFKGFMHSQVTAFILIFLLGILLIFSLTVTTLLSIFDQFAREIFSYGVDIVKYIDVGLSFFLVAFLCMAVYAFLPHAVISRRAIILGGFITAFLFFMGRLLIGLYLSWGISSSLYGAASTLIILMLWVYYSSQVLLFGAALTYIIDHKVKQPNTNGYRP